MQENIINSPLAIDLANREPSESFILHKFCLACIAQHATCPIYYWNRADFPFYSVNEFSFLFKFCMCVRARLAVQLQSPNHFAQMAAYNGQLWKYL